MRGSTASDGLFPLLLVGPLMESNTNTQTKEADAPPIASKPEEAVSDLITSINETAEQGQSPAISSEVNDIEKPVEVLIPKAEDCDNQVPKEENPKKLVGTLNSEQREDTLDKGADTETKKELTISDNIEDRKGNISTDNVENENKDSESDKVVNESDKPKEGRHRLSGAARKRFKWLLEKGHTHEEARRLAVIPMSADRGLKRILADSYESQPEVKIRKTSTINTAPNRTSQGYKVPSSSSTSKTSTGSIKIGILSKTYPEELLTTEKLKSIEATILERIVTQKEGEVKPKFLGTTFKIGFMVISCADTATSVWLKDAIDKIKPWEKASLVTVKEDKIPRAQILDAYFFNSTDDPNDKILGFIGAQNDGLNVGQWKVIQRKEDKTAVHLVLSADYKSVENLRKQDFKINYKFGQVHIRPKETPKTTQDKPKVENKQAYSSKPNKHSRRPPPPPKASSRRDRERDTWSSYREVGSTSRIDPAIFYNR